MTWVLLHAKSESDADVDAWRAAVEAGLRLRFPDASVIAARDVFNQAEKGWDGYFEDVATGVDPVWSRPRFVGGVVPVVTTSGVGRGTAIITEKMLAAGKPVYAWNPTGWWMVTGLFGLDNATRNATEAKLWSILQLAA